MRITRIEIKHFRGFPGPATFVFDLPNGENLLLCGENGSGKSSIYHALDQLFNIDPQARPFEDFANLFGKDANNQVITDGYVRVQLDGPPGSFTWNQGGTRPTDPVAIDAAMRKGFLEYRSLLRTSFVEGSLDDRLFTLAAEVLLSRIPVPIGGQQRTIGEYWAAVHPPATHHRRALEAAESVIDEFNQAFTAILPDVERKATELLEYFTGHYLKLWLEFDDLSYDRNQRTIGNQSLRLHVEFNDREIAHHESFLNEARLSALALSLFLASVLLSNPSAGPGIVSPLKLLALDDVLIGLDLSHRLPLLKILEDEFADYQVILLTYDQVWYEMAHLMTMSSGRWVYQELFSERVGDPGYEMPVLQGAESYVQQAARHLAAHDYRAATVYARAAFETRLRNFCERRRLPVPYHVDPRSVSSEDLWAAVTGARGGDGSSHVDATTEGIIESLRKVVLNPLSHTGASSITRTEVEETIRAVRGLTLN